MHIVFCRDSWENSMALDFGSVDLATLTKRLMPFRVQNQSVVKGFGHDAGLWDER